MPSPPSPTFHLGPLSGHWYGLCVSLAAIVFTVVTAAVWRRRGGDPITAAWACVLCLPLALVGARLYHYVTGGESTPGEHAIAFWQGGLGIFGAVAFGAATLLGIARVRRLDAWRLLDCAMPGLAVGQAIGRLGNWFNQELYGEPTNLPWGLRIDPAHRLAGYEGHTRFQPTFAYEALWDVGLAIVLWYLVTRASPLRRGLAVGVWMIGYGAGRFWIEGLRIEPATQVAGLRLNQVVALGVALAGVAVVTIRSRDKAATA